MEGSDVSEKAAEAPMGSGPDDNIVDWNGPNDLENPRNWKASKRYLHAILLSMITLNVNLASTMFAPGAPLLMRDLNNTSETIGTLTVSIYVLGFALGPLVLSPLSEMYGRLIIYQSTNFIFLAFMLGCALSKDITEFLIFRFISGCAGSAPLTIGGGTLADLFPQEERGKMMGLFALGPLLGPVIGPIAGGFIAEDIGWRWTFWVLLIISGVVNVVAIVFMRETYAPVILARKTTRLQKETKNPALRSKLDTGMRTHHLLAQSVLRPLKLLLFSPIVLLLSLYVAFAFGLVFLLFTTFPLVFSEQYDFGAGVIGLSYLGMGVGFFLGLIVFATFSDKILKAKAAKNERPEAPSTPSQGDEESKPEEENASAPPKYKPELRLFLMACLAPVLPFGFFWYGWSAEEKVHWIVPILATGLIGIGQLFIMMPVQTYLIDVFGDRAAASALAANTLLRSLFGSFLPLAGPHLYDALGLGWGNSLLGFIGLAFMPVPYLFYHYGETIRTKHPVHL